MSDDKPTKTVKKLVFIYPDNRAGSHLTVYGEGFEVCTADGDYVTELPEGGYELQIAIKKTVIEKLDGKKDKVRVVDTGLKKTIRIRPTYLWVEIEEVQVPIEQ